MIRVKACASLYGVAAAIGFFAVSAVYAVDWPIFDVHIHYSHDAWESISPTHAVKRLRDAGVVRAMVSSSNDDGTQKLYQADPELVIPALRPYRHRGELRTWMRDETVLDYLKSRLAQYRYVAIGEFHIDGAEADLPVVRGVVDLAREHRLMLHVHSDAEAVRRIFKQDPQALIIWAHAGFEQASQVNDMFDTYKHLWADLSFRREIYHNGKFMPLWRELLTEHSDRFMLGIDTYLPERWNHIRQEVAWMHSLLNALPKEVAERIARQNAERVVAAHYAKITKSAAP